MIVSNVNDAQFQFKLKKSSCEVFLYRNADLFRVGLGFAYTLLSSVGVVLGLIEIMLVALIPLALLLVIWFWSHVEKTKMDEHHLKEYTHYLHGFSQKILMDNIHSPEQDQATKDAIKEFLNTQYKGWSVSQPNQEQ